MGLIDFVKSGWREAVPARAAQTAMAGDAGRCRRIPPRSPRPTRPRVMRSSTTSRARTCRRPDSPSPSTAPRRRQRSTAIADDQATKEKIILCLRQRRGVAKVNDMMTVSVSEPPAEYYTVVSGDTLSKNQQAVSTATPTST